MSLVEAVRCDKCNALHDATLQDFVSVTGTITLGKNKPIVGTLSGERSVVANKPESKESLFHYCYPICFFELFKPKESVQPVPAEKPNPTATPTVAPAVKA